MKKLILISFLALTASLAYAGSCGGCSDKKGDKDKCEKAQIENSILAKSCGGCGDKGDKDKKGCSAAEASYEVAGSCGGCGDKDKKGCGVSTASYELAKSCGDGGCGDKDKKGKC